MKALLVATLVAFGCTTFAQRKLNNLPTIPDYVTLKGDFHVHTDFSDGAVWPTFRVDEAVREGIDIIALSDQEWTDVSLFSWRQPWRQKRVGRTFLP